MGICSLLITIILYFTETIYFRAATLNFYVVFPCILNGNNKLFTKIFFRNLINYSYIFAAVTLGGLIYLPKRLKIWDPPMEDEENVQLLKQAGAKRRRNIRRNN